MTKVLCHSSFSTILGHAAGPDDSLPLGSGRNRVGKLPLAPFQATLWQTFGLVSSPMGSPNDEEFFVIVIRAQSLPHSGLFLML
jgi:hypothetical protein